LLELIHASLSCTKEEGLIQLMNRLGSLISFDYAICGLGKIDDTGKIESYGIINVSYPSEWLELYITKEYHQIDPIVKENFTHFRLQYWADTYKMNPPPKVFVSLAEDFGLKRGYTNGIKDCKGGSLFSIAGKCVECNPCTEIILKHTIPHLHQALISIFKQGRTKQRVELSPKEKEVLKWLKEGKSTWEISVILSISQNTAKFHIKNIMQKLDAVKRS